MSCQKWMGTIAAGAALFLQFVILQAGAGWAWIRKVVGIADGDTITVLRDGHEQFREVVSSVVDLGAHGIAGKLVL